jgi:hypothetical protein
VSHGSPGVVCRLWCVDCLPGIAHASNWYKVVILAVHSQHSFLSLNKLLEFIALVATAGSAFGKEPSYTLDKLCLYQLYSL